MKEVIAIDPQLAINLKLAKDNLDIAKKAVEHAQGEIYIAAGRLPEKGVTHVTGCTITTKFYDKWDTEKLNVIEHIWSTKSNLPFPFKREWKADGKAITYIRENAKEAYAVLADALTLTPAKPSFELTEEKQ